MENQSVSELSKLIERIIQEETTKSLADRDISLIISKVIEEIKNNSQLTQTTTTQQKSESNTSKITAAEASNLWTQYLGDTLSIGMYTYFLTFVEDAEIKSILEFALSLSEQHIKKITEFFKQDNYQVPMGLTKDDVELKAPRLFTDPFLLYYTEIMTVHGLMAYSLAITTSEGEDVRKHFIECSKNAAELFDKTVKLFQKRGEFSGSPIIPPLQNVEFVEKKGTFSDLLGDPKPLAASEINNLFFNLKKTIFEKAMCLAFGQVATSKEVREYMVQATELAQKHINDFSAILTKDNLPSPRLWDSEVTDSKVSPFSEKLTMLHSGFLYSTALAYYGTGMASTIRADVTALYSKTILEVMKASNDWLNLMVKNEWLEKQPHAADRKALAHSK